VFEASHFSARGQLWSAGMHIRHSLRSHFFGSALLLTIAASYGLLAGLSRQAWAASAAAAYLVIYAAVLLIAILSVYRAYLSLTAPGQNLGGGPDGRGRGGAPATHPRTLPAGPGGLAQTPNAGGHSPPGATPGAQRPVPPSGAVDGAGVRPARHARPGGIA